MTAKVEIEIDDYLLYLQEEEERRKADLMYGFRPRRGGSRPRIQRRVVPLKGHRFVYFRRGTTDREVHTDGTVWCLHHDEQLREYPDKRGHVQRKCRSCQNEYMRRWKARARERAGGEKTVGRNEDSPVQT